MVHDFDNMAAGQDKNPSRLEQLEPLLGPLSEAELTAALQRYTSFSDRDLKSKISMLQDMSAQRVLKDGGDKALKQCQVFEAVLKRRQLSKNWRQLVSWDCIMTLLGQQLDLASPFRPNKTVLKATNPQSVVSRHSHQAAPCKMSLDVLVVCMSLQAKLCAV